MEYCNMTDIPISFGTPVLMDSSQSSQEYTNRNDLNEISRSSYESTCMGSQAQFLNSIDSPTFSGKIKSAKLRQQANTSPEAGVVLATKQYSYKLSQILYQQQQDNKYCDFTLKLENGREIPAHRTILAATSTYFSCLFNSGMVENKTGYVSLHGIKEHAALEMIKFIYTGKIYITKDTVRDLVDAASHLQVEPALRLTSHYLITTMQKSNCVEVCNLAEKFCLKKVKEHALVYMKQHFVQLTDDQLLLLAFEQLTALLESNGLLCSSEWDVFSQVEKWLKHVKDRSLLTQYAVKLMELIRFPLMTGEELVSKVSKVEFMREIAECANILTEAKDYHIVHSSQPVMQNNRTQVRHADIIYMAACQERDFYMYPLFSTNYKLLTEPIELSKPPRPLHWPAICVYNNFLYACGGFFDKSNQSISSALCFRYDPRSDSWFEIASMHEARQKFELRVIGDYMFALGGQDESELSHSYEVYSFEKDEWKVMTCPNEFLKTARQASVSYNNSIYVTGGHLGAYVTKAAFEYCHIVSKPGTLEVRRLPQMHVARKKHHMLAYKDKLICLGGQSDTFEIFDLNTQQWTLYSGFGDILSHIGHTVGICAMDPTRVIITSCRYQNSSYNNESKMACCVTINLEKDPDSEKQLFIRKLNIKPRLSNLITSFGTQIWLPAMYTLTKMKDSQLTDVVP